MNRITLLGDSVFDNGVYVPGEPDVVSQLRECLPEGWDTSMLAQDGAVTRNVKAQLERVPENTTHLVVSVGGNDGLKRMSELLADPEKVLSRVPDIIREFQEDYRAMLDALTETGLPITVCTVYGGDFQDQERADLAQLGTGVINDVIVGEARERGIPVLDLREIFTSKDDYTNTVEPSAQGGDKLARAIATLVVQSATREDTNDVEQTVDQELGQVADVSSSVSTVDQTTPQDAA